MKRLLLSLLLCPALAMAQPGPLPLAKSPEAEFQFNRIALSQFVQLVYMEVIRTPYVLDPEVLADMRELSIRYSASTDGDLRKFLRELLDGYGYSVERRAGFDRIAKAAPAEKVEPEKSILVYRPKHRDASYIAGLTQTVLGGARFSIQRGLPSASPQTDAAQSAPIASPTSAAGVLDRRADVLILQGLPAELALFQQLAPQIDTPLGEVVVQATLYEVSSSESDGSGFTLAASILGGKLGVQIGSAAPESALRFKLTGSTSIDAVFGALSADSRFKVVSSPRLRVRSGATAKLVVGEDVPVLGAVSYPGQGGQAVRSVDYRSSGVILGLTPTVRDGGIDLRVEQQLSNFVSTNTGVNDSPTLVKRSLETQVLTDSDEVVVLGGLQSQKADAATSAVPFLPSIFGSRSSRSTTSDLLLVMRVTKI